MKKREKRFEEHKEHKLGGKGIVISPQDILTALNKVDKILPDSGPAELTLAKTKVAAEKEKFEQEREQDVQKAKKIAHLNVQIEDIKKVINKLRKQGVKDLQEIMKPSKPTRDDIREIEATIKRKEKELAEKQEELQVLKSPSFELLQPSEMVDALIYSPYRNSLNEVLVKLEGVTAKSSAQELIDTANSLLSLARIEPLKSKINSRKDFLKTTKEKLPLLAKLPKKPGDKDSILHVINSFKEKMGVIFLFMTTNYMHNLQIYFQVHYIF